jgi:hypothetical protein
VKFGLTMIAEVFVWYRVVRDTHTRVVLPNFTRIASYEPGIRLPDIPDCTGGVVENGTLEVLKAAHASSDLLVCGHLDVLVLSVRVRIGETALPTTSYCSLCEWGRRTMGSNFK